MTAGGIFPGREGNNDLEVHNRSAFSASGVSTILVPTTLNFSNEEVRFWNNLTFFFDRWWEPETDRETLPFCMFQVANYSDAQQAELSKKRVMVYQPPSKEGSADAEVTDTAGAMQVVVDNIMVQPKTYNLSLIVPSSPAGRWIKSRLQLQRYLQQVLGGFSQSLDEATRSFMQGEMTRMADTMDIMRQYVSMSNIYMSNTRRAENDSGANMANKNSLDAMVERGRVLMFKTWMGNDYKYVVVTSKTAEKKGTEDGVWRVSLTVQEVPVLSLTPVTKDIGRPDKGWVQKYADTFGSAFGMPQMGTKMPAFAEAST